MLETQTKLAYTGFGLKILSNIELPELVPHLPHQNRADVTIKRVDLKQLWNRSSNNQCFIFEGNRILFKVPDTGIFLVDEGKTIMVSPDAEADEGLIRLFILGTCMGAILMQRKILPLHGSAIAINGKAYAFVGESGVGKSTLASAFIKKGFQIISDDIIPVLLSNNSKPIVIPSYPQQKLWQESLNQFGMELNNFHPLYARESKYSIPVQTNFYSDNLPLGGVFELVIGEEEKIEIQPIKGLERFHTLYRNTYRNLFLKPLGLIDWHFTTSTKLINQLPLYQVIRPTSRFTAQELVTLFLDNIYKEINS
ncbi:aldolase [Bacillus sp. USDA818B3_A]|uniref:aldolase n=1 Tax=Bacillus sp. USDA818B3_A TaxID=2698834 RepID=UPI00136CD7F5|nr:aldolase [Bacillus sp. USDA818B3_A]